MSILSFLIGLVIGFLAGGIFGIFFMALMQIAKGNDDDE